MAEGRLRAVFCLQYGIVARAPERGGTGTDLTADAILRGVMLGGGLSELGRLIDLYQAAVLHIVNVAVDRDVLRHQRMVADAHYVFDHASGKVADRVPFDELAVDRAGALADVGPAAAPELRGG